MPDNKHKKELISASVDMDSVIGDDGQFSKLVLQVTDHNDDSAAAEICRGLSVYSKSRDKYIIRASNVLKNALIDYYGYLRIIEICNTKKHPEKEDNKTLNELLDELNNLVGLDVVKKKVSDLIAYQSVRKKREEQGLYAQGGTMHLAFTGNPGTGKTTVARIVGRIYKQIGILSKGHFIEVSRTDLIAGYQGQTALKVKSVIERARGGVLFIDEAYSLTENDHADSYGRECLTELTKALEDYRDDLVVIVAGYTKPMEQFFESNPGLKSRFNSFIEFADYSADELYHIMKSICTNNCYTFTHEAEKALQELFIKEESCKSDEFANGRFVRNIFEDIIMNHARRVNALQKPDKQRLMEITLDDVLEL